MTSIPKTPKRGNGRDPKSTGSFRRYASLSHASSDPGQISSDVSPWDAITHVQQICDLLDAYFGFDYFGGDGLGYSVELDLTYQSLVSRVVSLMDTAPWFGGLWWPGSVAPPFLGHADRGSWWGHYNGDPGRNRLIELQSEMVAALVAAGVSRPTTGSSVSSNPIAELATNDSLEAPFTIATSSPALVDAKRGGPARDRNPGSRSPGRPRKEVPAVVIAEVFWGMKDERIGTPNAKYDPTQPEVCERLAEQGRGISPGTLSKILRKAGVPWPPPRPPFDDSIDDA